MNSLIGADGLPLWDTFETLLFFATGIVIGIVFGFLFPSLWRTFRRHFRSASRLDRLNLSPSDLENLPLALSWIVEPGPENGPDTTVDSGVDSERDSGTHPSTRNPESAAAIERSFVSARALFQSGHARESVQQYLAILKSPGASSQQSARVYLELSQIYGELGLLDRALAAAKEYQTRRRGSPKALELVATMAQKSGSVDETMAAVNRFRGNLQSVTLAPLSLSIAHVLCEPCEDRLNQCSVGLGFPLQAQDLKRIDECLSMASRLAPLSLRLRHVRALRTLHDALSAAKSADDIWVSFFAEMSKRISLALSFGVPLTLAVGPLRTILYQLAKLPPADPLAIETARTIAMREWLTSHSWAQAQEAKDALTQQILLAPTSLPMGLTATREAFTEEALRAVERAAFGHQALVQSLEDHTTRRGGLAARAGALGDSPSPLLNSSKFSCLDALRVAITKHTCSTCGLAHFGFHWHCLKCGSRESLRPSFEGRSAGSSPIS